MRMNMSRTRAEAWPSSVAPGGRVPGSGAGFCAAMVIADRSLGLPALRAGEFGAVARLVHNFRQTANGCLHEPRGNLDPPFGLADFARKNPQHASTARLFVACKNRTQFRSRDRRNFRQRP